MYSKKNLEFLGHFRNVTWTFLGGLYTLIFVPLLFINGVLLLSSFLLSCVFKSIHGLNWKMRNFPRVYKKETVIEESVEEAIPVYSEIQKVKVLPREEAVYAKSDSQ